MIECKKICAVNSIYKLQKESQTNRHNSKTTCATEKKDEFLFCVHHDDKHLRTWTCGNNTWHPKICFYSISQCKISQCKINEKVSSNILEKKACAVISLNKTSCLVKKYDASVRNLVTTKINWKRFTNRWQPKYFIKSWHRSKFWKKKFWSKQSNVNYF